MPYEYTTHVLLSNLIIISLVLLMVNLQFLLIAFSFSMKSKPMQVLARLVSWTFLPLQKKTLSNLLEFYRSVEERVWYDLDWLTAMRLFWLTSRMLEMLEEKLKCTGSGINS